MTTETEQQLLETLRELRDGQRELVAMLKAQQALAQEQLKRSRETISESVGMQRLALQRQKTVVVIALPLIAVCLAAIGYLVIRYF